MLRLMLPLLLGLLAGLAFPETAFADCGPHDWSPAHCVETAAWVNGVAAGALGGLLVILSLLQGSSPGVAAPPSPEQLAQQALEDLQAEAKQQAARPGSVDPSSPFFRRLQDHYLKDYFDGKETAQLAIDKIAKPFTGTPDPNDYWEQNADAWAKPALPESLRKQLEDRLGGNLPADLGAATDILSLYNRNDLPNIDVPHLLGKGVKTPGTDYLRGGKNESQLMHWATGVKYANADPQAVRGLFLAYEKWHLEGWDVFGEDAMNDMIAEEQGRIFGRMLLEGKVNKGNQQQALNDSFAEARAWVGSLLKMRQKEFEDFVTAKEVKKGLEWWENEKDMWTDELGNPYKSFQQMFAEGKSLDDVKKSSFYDRLRGVKTLIHEVDEWEKKKGAVPHSPFERQIMRGEWDDVFRELKGGGGPAGTWPKIRLWWKVPGKPS